MVDNTRRVIKTKVVNRTKVADKILVAKDNTKVVDNTKMKVTMIVDDIIMIDLTIKCECVPYELMKLCTGSV